MKIRYNCARSTRSASALKLFSTLTLAVAGVFCSVGPAWSAPILGSNLASFAVLGAPGVTNVLTSTIGGNLGSAPNASAGGGYVFSSGSLQANTAVWNFLFTSSLSTSSTSNVNVQNIGDGSGVGLYWTVARAATLNGPTFAGNVLAHDFISSDCDLTITCGRLLSAETQVTLIHDNISITGCAGTSGGFDQGVFIGSGGQTVPESSTLALLGLGVAALGFARRRN